MKNSCRCFWVPFCGFRRLSCPFFLEYHHVVVSESLQGSSHICISVKLDLFRCLARDRKSLPQRKNVAKYLRKRDLSRNLFHKQHVYHPKSINIQQSFQFFQLWSVARFTCTSEIWHIYITIPPQPSQLQSCPLQQTITTCWTTDLPKIMDIYWILHFLEIYFLQKCA